MSARMQRSSVEREHVRAIDVSVDDRVMQYDHGTWTTWWVMDEGSGFTQDGEELDLAVEGNRDECTAVRLTIARQSWKFPDYDDTRPKVAASHWNRRTLYLAADDPVTVQVVAGAARPIV